eukprot:GHVR01121300.1.p1 GENE.GHVR01121300.1~~GHVR01121300.1.p1  ORF type:complete len:588 (-),score=117.24 GHVR01121300.1:145-1908(-)
MSLSILSSLQEYVRSMIDKVSGMKALILDKETTGILSLLYSQTQILEKEVFLVDMIETEHKERMKHVNAIVFVRPTVDNINRLIKEMRSPSYGEYHIFFSNIVRHDYLEKLAKSDENEVVHQVQEFYVDVYAINHDLFTLNLPYVSGLTQESSLWTASLESCFQRLIEGLFAAVLSLKVNPVIRFQRSSEICRKIALQLQTKMSHESALFDAASTISHNNGCILLLCDRREDPITPLLNQWTYQSMIHELIGSDNNRVSLHDAHGVSDELKEIVMSPAQDQFYEKHAYDNFGDLGVAIKNYVDQYQEKTQTSARVESIEDMQKFVDAFPEFKKLAGNVSKHVAVVHELSRIVTTNNLLDLSSLEQDIACADNRQEHARLVLEKIRTVGIPHKEALRLVMLFALRYESDSHIRQMKDALRSIGVEEGRVGVVEGVLSYAGRHVRSMDLFGNRSFLKQAQRQLKRGFNGVPNVYTQHRTLLSSTLDSLFKGKLRDSDFPYVVGGVGGVTGKTATVRPTGDTQVLLKEKNTDCLVFMVGGCTYEEAREINQINTQSQYRVILGGTSIINSNIFINDVFQIQKIRRASQCV